MIEIMWIHEQVKVCQGKGVRFLLLFVVYSILIDAATANLILIGRNMSVSFEDVEANFAPSVKGSGERGILYVAEPLDACSQLTNIISEEMGSSFALIIRGGCTFDDKVRKAQNAGFKAAIVYDNEDGGILVAMAGSSAGIKIPAVFISKRSGDVLKKYSGLPDMEIWIIPTFENSAWSIMAISFICLLSMSALLATCFFVRRHRIRREHPRSTQVREFHGMSSQLVKAMPSLIFTSVLEDNCTSQTCAICLDDYSVGDKLRILPCHHKFHATCVDSWLTTWRAFCPICKRDARKSMGIPPASECTPLLSSSSIHSSSSVASSLPSVAPSPVIQIAPSPLSRSSTRSFRSSFAPSPTMQVPPQRFSPSSSLASSFRSFLAASPPMQIPSTSSQSSNIHTPPLTVSRQLPRPPLSFNNLHALSQSRSTLDLRNSSFQRSNTSHFALPRSLGNSLNSAYDSRYTSPYIPTAYIPSPSNASPSFIGSSGRQSCLLHCSESNASFSPLASAQSLPGC